MLSPSLENLLNRCFCAFGPATHVVPFQSFMFYSKGVYYEPTCGNTDADLDHEVLAVGFGTDPVVRDVMV
jgi:hypothetical protein